MSCRRVAAACALAVAVALAGCATGSRDAGAPSPTPAAEAGEDYLTQVLYPADVAHVDVLLLVPASAQALDRLQALVDVVEDWQAALREHGPAWLSGAELVAYAPGLHAAPPVGYQADDPEVVIALGGDAGSSGTAMGGDFCEIGTPAWTHQHPGSSWRILRAPCDDGRENACLVWNLAVEPTQEGLYRIASHEFGHCLGVGHVGDARDFEAPAVPVQDVMSYNLDLSLPYCPSSLDLLALEAAFAGVLGQPAVPVGQPFGDGRGFVRQAPADYTQPACAGPTQARSLSL